MPSDKITPTYLFENDCRIILPSREDWRTNKAQLLNDGEIYTYIINTQMDLREAIWRKRKVRELLLPKPVSHDNASRTKGIEAAVQLACFGKGRPLESAYMLRQPCKTWNQGVKFDPEMTICWTAAVALDSRTKRNQWQRENKWPCTAGSEAATYGPHTSWGNIPHIEKWIEIKGC